MESECIRCGVSAEEVRLFDAIYDGGLNLICERCSIIENIPIIRKPNLEQLKNSEKRVNLHDKMNMASKPYEKNEIFSIKESLEELEKNPRLELPAKKQLNLIDNFHWEIMRQRRRKGLSQKQFAELIQESEIAVAMLEKSIIPEKAENLIKKIEQYLQIKLRKEIVEETKKGPILLDEDGRVLEFIPEPKIECRVEIEEDNIKSPLLDNMAITKCSTIKPAQNENTSVVRFGLERLKNQNKDASISSNIQKNIPTSVTSPPEKKSEQVESPYLRRLKEREQAFKRLKEPSEKKSFNLNPDKKTSSFSTHIDSIKSMKKTENMLKGNVDSKETEKDLKKKVENWGLSNEDLKNVTINDLRRLHKKRIEATKEEKIQEKKKIEERQKIVEARKEELRLMKEKESKDIDSYLGGKELLNDDFKADSIELDED
jgi:ribosome-binding protein aMBF1 (putative translation factor)